MTDPSKISNVIALPSAQPTPAPTSRPQPPIKAHFNSPEWAAYRAASDAWDRTPEGIAEAERHTAQLRAEEAERQRKNELEARGSRLQRAKDLRVTDAVSQKLVHGGLDETLALETTKTWLNDDNAKPWLVLSGATGCGKSVAAAWTISRAGGVWIRAEKLVRLFYANFGEQYDEQEKVRDCGLLVLDDVGSELDAARMCGVLLEIADYRKSTRHHRTVLTTNLTSTAFKARYPDARLHSRLAEQAQFFGDTSADLRRAK